MISKVSSTLTFCESTSARDAVRMISKRHQIWRDLYRNRCKRIQRKEPVSNALLSHSSLPFPNLGCTVVIGDRFWREGPRVGGERRGGGRRPEPDPGLCSPPLRPPGLALALRLGGRGSGRAGLLSRPWQRRGGGEHGGRRSPEETRRPRPAHLPSLTPARPRTSAVLRSPW